MSAADVASALQTINAGITGVKQAPTAMPGHLAPADLPMALTYPGPAEHENISFNHLGTNRLYLVRLYVLPIGLGRGVDEGYQKCLPFLQRFRDEYITQRLGTDSNWDCLGIIADSGIRADMTLHNAPTEEYYWGIEFTVQVTHFTAG